MKKSPKFWAALVIFSLVGQIAWVVENMYLNVFIYKMFNASAADISNMVSASAIAATLTTVLGMIPMAVGQGEGSEMWRSLGMVVAWGLSISTLVTLVIIPTVYASMASWQERRAARKAARKAA